MKLESYQENLVIVNQNTDPKRHGVCGNDGIISFSPPSLREKFMAEHAALMAVVEAAKSSLYGIRVAQTELNKAAVSLAPLKDSARSDAAQAARNLCAYHAELSGAIEKLSHASS